MSARSRARRERADAAPSPAAAPAAKDAGGASRPPRQLRLPLLPALAAAAGLILLAAAWTTRWAPGEPQAASQGARFTVDPPDGIASWEAFFICYDLASESNIVDLTLRANQREHGSLDFPADDVIVELPAPDSSAPVPASSEGEEALLAVKTGLSEAVTRGGQRCSGL